MLLNWRLEGGSSCSLGLVMRRLMVIVIVIVVVTCGLLGYDVMPTLTAAATVTVTTRVAARGLFPVRPAPTRA
ncbi:hypothetical protein [Embleya hyalina]|uniref:Uncharacterized protein n=1 Tax=Embleya hyalina TaxID=516124 RepID=A0A401YYQ6_9ACTN|nr:hypothetical protein [Embleya hyalina]GCD99680.1 hypothetical protein EHYA_07402 [Embleya hyalina]